MITGINFGGLAKPQPPSKPLIAPLPEEYKQSYQIQAIKNILPKPVK